MTLIARLRILLNDVDPQPMRHIEVPLKIRLDRLHEVVQAAMGWTDSHLYEFRAGGGGLGRARSGRILRRPDAREEGDAAEGARGYRRQDDPVCLRLR
jgi:hypothetical protein